MSSLQVLDQKANEVLAWRPDGYAGTLGRAMHLAFANMSLLTGMAMKAYHKEQEPAPESAGGVDAAAGAAGADAGTLDVPQQQGRPAKRARRSGGKGPAPPRAAGAAPRVVATAPTFRASWAATYRHLANVDYFTHPHTVERLLPVFLALRELSAATHVTVLRHSIATAGDLMDAITAQGAALEGCGGLLVLQHEGAVPSERLLQLLERAERFQMPVAPQRLAPDWRPDDWELGRAKGVTLADFLAAARALDALLDPIAYALRHRLGLDPGDALDRSCLAEALLLVLPQGSPLLSWYGDGQEFFAPDPRGRPPNAVGKPEPLAPSLADDAASYPPVCVGPDAAAEAPPGRLTLQADWTRQTSEGAPARAPCNGAATAGGGAACGCGSGPGAPDDGGGACRLRCASSHSVTAMGWADALMGACMRWAASARSVVRLVLGVGCGAVIGSMLWTQTPIHYEDGYLGAINCLLWGAPKVWYVVPRGQAQAFEALLDRYLQLAAAGQWGAAAAPVGRSGRRRNAGQELQVQAQQQQQLQQLQQQAAHKQPLQQQQPRQPAEPGPCAPLLELARNGDACPERAESVGALAAANSAPEPLAPAADEPLAQQVPLAPGPKFQPPPASQQPQQQQQATAPTPPPPDAATRIYAKLHFYNKLGSSQLMATFLRDLAGLGVRRLVQPPGTTVVTLNGPVLHWTISTGASIADAMNICIEEPAASPDAWGLDAMRSAWRALVQRCGAGEALYARDARNAQHVFGEYERLRALAAGV